MYSSEERFSSYKREIIYFTVYSAGLFIFKDAVFLTLKTLPYFVVGYMLSGIATAIFMSIQFKIEHKLNPNFWILNILIEVVGYFAYTYLMFNLFSF